MRQIPNLFTLLNLVFGCIAMVFILQNGIIISGDEEGATWIDVPEKIWLGSLFIGLAAVVDFLDGFVARLFKASSAMGKQLDSLADLVSFGVAPGMIMYQFLRLSFASEQHALDTSFLWLIPAFLIPCAAAWRLARFNLDESQSYSFKGLPVPATGIFIASIPLIYINVNEDWTNELLRNKWFHYAIITLFSWLMVSRLPIMAMKFRDYSFSANYPKYILLIAAIAAVVILKWMSIPFVILLYVLLSLIFKPKANEI
jgi:CDP-diacylglycerol---serine O-phosphatidyltransferase